MDFLPGKPQNEVIFQSRVVAAAMGGLKLGFRVWFSCVPKKEIDRKTKMEKLLYILLSPYLSANITYNFVLFF